MILQAIIKTADGDALGLLVLNEKHFTSGSRGYHGQGKIEIGGRRYQAQCQLVEIGSKDADKNGEQTVRDAGAPAAGVST